MEKSSSIIPIHITIPKFYEKAAGKVVIFYLNIIQMGKEIWEVEKRFSQYDDLNTILKKKYANLPRMPSKGFFKLNADGCERRRIELQEYVRGLAKRADLRTDPFFRDFFELDLHNSNTICYSPVKITELSELPLGIRDFHYLNDKGLLFFALSDMKITSRLDSYLTNVSLPWEKKDDTYATVGALLFYRVGLREKDGEWIFTRLWAKNFPIQTNILFWCAEKQQMYLGMDDGRIYVYSITNKEMSLNQDTELKAHSKRVMGISYEAEYEHIISISEDGKLKCSELTSEDPVFELTLGKSGLKCLIHDKDHKRLFVGAGDGSVYIVSHVNYPPELIATIKTLNESCIRGMCIDNDKKFLFTGDTNGFINCFDLGPVGKERFAKQVTEMSGMSKIRFLVWANENREIFAGNQNGKVTIWDTLKGQSVFVHEAHENAITKMQFFDKSRYLMTSSKEKLFNIWEMPREWIKEELPDAIPDDEEAKFKSKKLKQMLEPKEEIKETEDFNREEVKFSGFEPTDAFKNMEDGFDPLGGSKFKASNINRNDDDLMGWHK